MKTLKERKADRARRVIENQTADTTGVDRVGELASAMATIHAEASALSPKDQDELRARLSNSFEPTEGYQPDPVFPLAGIGVTNPFVVETADISAIAGGAQSGNGGEADPSNVSPGDALAAAQAAAAWGTGAPADASGATDPSTGGTAGGDADPTVGEDGKPLTKDALKAILDARTPPVKYESDANLERLQELVRG